MNGRQISLCNEAQAPTAEMAVTPPSLFRPGSSVIINASVGARKGWPTTSTVSTCKAAVVHLARILSAELVDRGIPFES